MTRDDPAFLAAICAAPDDDAPRLVYADWLDEHGQAERAEFIRVQCRIAYFETQSCIYQGEPWPNSPPARCCLVGNPDIDPNAGCPKCRELGRMTSREGELILRDTRQPFLPRLPIPMKRWGFTSPDSFAEVRRGFVERVQATAADWLAHADAILAAHPVREVRLTTWPLPEPPVPGRSAFLFVDSQLNQRWPGVTFHLP